MSDAMTLRNINEMKRLMANVRGDITATGQRAKDMKEFVESVGVYTNVNPLTSTQHLDQTTKVVQGITEAFDAGYKGQGVGGHRSVYRELSHKYTMGYVTRMGDDMKEQLQDILAKNMDKGLGWQETAKDMAENVDGMTRERAIKIARTESVRAKNLGQWAEHKEMGYKYFEVLPHSTACKKCKEAYTGVVFPMTGKFTVMLPPLHPNCRCATRYYKTVPAGYKVVKQVPKEYMPQTKVSKPKSKQQVKKTSTLPTSTKSSTPKKISTSKLTTKPSEILSQKGFFDANGELTLGDVFVYNKGTVNELKIIRATKTEAIKGAQKLTNNAVIKKYNQLPPKVRESVKEVHLLDKPNIEDAYRTKLTGKKFTTFGTGDPEEGVITFYKNSHMKNPAMLMNNRGLAHEAAHC
jgi:SPP1 gp7 family putative phage head morphogenesis protein